MDASRRVQRQATSATRMPRSRPASASTQRRRSNDEIECLYCGHEQEDGDTCEECGQDMDA